MYVSMLNDMSSIVDLEVVAEVLLTECLQLIQLILVA